MRIWIWTIIAAVSLSACASREDIMKNYEERIDYSNGVEFQEAKIIAQRKIISVEEKRNYKITAPGVLNNAAAKAYEDYWFVVFGPNWLSPISTDGSAKTYTQLKEARYLVVISKIDGQIVFAGEYFPKRSPEFNWVFEERQPWRERVDPPAGIPSE